MILRKYKVVLLMVVIIISEISGAPTTVADANSIQSNAIMEKSSAVSNNPTNTVTLASNSVTTKVKSNLTENSLLTTNNAMTTPSNAIVNIGATSNSAINAETSSNKNRRTTRATSEQPTTSNSPTSTTDFFVTTTEDPSFFTTESTTVSASSKNEGNSAATPKPLTPETATTADGSPCKARYRKVEGMNDVVEVATSDYVFTGLRQRCPRGLHWREDRCRCDYPQQEANLLCNCCNKGFMKNEKNRHDYKMLVYGRWVDASCTTQSTAMVWDDEKCSCDWDKQISQKSNPVRQKQVEVPKYNVECIILLNMSLDTSLRDEQGQYIKKPPRPRMQFRNIKGAINGAMAIRRSPFEVTAFRNNDLTKNFYASFRFKVHSKTRKSMRDMYLFTNGCNDVAATFSVSFYPGNKTLSVLLSTERKTVLEFLKPREDPDGWYTVEMYIQDKVLTVIVNKEKLYESNGMRGSVKTTGCNLRVAGSSTDPSHHLDGFMDEILIVKQCPYAKIKKYRAS